jgi:Tn3 transposase DDE domain
MADEAHRHQPTIKPLRRNAPVVWPVSTRAVRHLRSACTPTSAITGDIFHAQPLILYHRRKAGAAIEDIIRHEEIENIELAGDTHGHTDFAMALAKLLGFDLCPHLNFSSPGAGLEKLLAGNDACSEPVSKVTAKLSRLAAQIEVEVHGRFFVQGIFEVAPIEQVIGIEREFILS